MTVPQTALIHLGTVSKEYQKWADEYRKVAKEAARAEAAHKSARAKAILRFKASETERISHAEAETRAEADDEIAGLYLDRLVKTANAESHREKLRQLREQVATGRTMAVDSREVDKIHAHGWSGAA